MTRYAALLRAVNLGSHNKIGMKALSDLFVAMGYEDAQTYVQSGNVVFTGPARGRKRVVQEIEDAIAKEFGHTVPVMLRTHDELAALAGRNPFLGREKKVSELHVTFLASTPAAAKVSGFEKPAGETAEASVSGEEVFLHCPDGYGRTKLNNAFIERKLGVPATTRGWNTVTNLRELTGAG